MSYTIIRKPPSNLRDEDRPDFEHHFEMALTPATITYTGPGTWLSTPQVVFSASGRAYAPSITYDSERTLLNRRYYWPRRLLQKRVRLHSPALLITDRHSRNYYHWHTEALPNLVNFLRTPEAMGDWQLLIPATAAAMPYVQQSLPLFVPQAGRIVFAEDARAYQAKRFIHCRKLLPFGHQDAELLRGVVEVFKRQLPAAGVAATRKIYLRRTGVAASKRSLSNEEEVMALLENYGYECLDFDSLDYFAQIALCRQTRVLISIHGAGLANMLFLPPASAVFEFKNRRDINYFYFMAEACGHRYHYQACASEQRVADHIGHLTVDVERLKADIERHHLY